MGRVCVDAHYEHALGGSVVLGDVPDHFHHQWILQLERSLHQHLQSITWREKTLGSVRPPALYAEGAKKNPQIYTHCKRRCNSNVCTLPSVFLFTVTGSVWKWGRVLTFADELRVPLVGRQIDAEGDELGVYALLAAVEQHLHHLSVSRSARETSQQENLMSSIEAPKTYN